MPGTNIALDSVYSHRLLKRGEFELSVYAALPPHVSSKRVNKGTDWA